MGSIPTEVKKIFSLPRVVPCFPLLGLTPSGLFMGLSSTVLLLVELLSLGHRSLIKNKKQINSSDKHIAGNILNLHIS